LLYCSGDYEFPFIPKGLMYKNKKNDVIWESR